uniref:Uncharacterized protein n=1 Tax=Rangifer tarandus platyrhynchus TaxID=3082113 RepID=A0ACB0DVU1_RANTA|nr:unnamed protein product [Rangifer tarandus platyrhynchus]
MAVCVRSYEVFALFYTVTAPMFNRLISTLRNADMKNAMRKVWGRDKHSAGKGTSGCPALCRIYFIHKSLMLTSATDTEGACAVIRSCNPEE